MDIKSIVRVFKFNELSRQAERDPSAKRPPTIKFLGVTLLVAALAVGFGYLVMTAEEAGPATGSAGGALTVPTDATNTTSPAPTSSPAAGPGASHEGPVLGRDE